MVRPDREQFEQLARHHDVVPVVEELTSDTVTPFVIYARLAARGLDRMGDLSPHLGVERVHHLRTVERQGRNVIGNGQPDRGHVAELLSR